MKAHFPVGARVRWQFGAGIVTDPTSLRAMGLVGVRWDEPPPVEYNLGANPCYVLAEWLEEVPANASV